MYTPGGPGLPGGRRRRGAAGGGAGGGGGGAAEATGAEPGVGAARGAVHHGAVHGAGRARLAPHPRRHLRPAGAGRRRRAGLRGARAAARLLHEPPDRAAAARHRRLLLPGHHLQPLGLPAGRLRAQAPGAEDHSPLRFRPHPHSPAVRHRHRVLLLGLGADPGAAAAAQEVPRLPGLRHLCRQLLPGGGGRGRLHPRHRRQPAAPLPHRGGGAGPGAAVGDGGERALPGRVRGDQPVPATPGLHPLRPPRLRGACEAPCPPKPALTRGRRSRLLRRRGTVLALPCEGLVLELDLETGGGARSEAAPLFPQPPAARF